MNRNQFTFYRSFYDAVKVLPKKDQTAVILAICAYALDNEEPKLTGTAAAIFTLVRPMLDSSRKKAESGKRGGEAEAKPKQNGSKTEAKPKQEKEQEIEQEKEQDKEQMLLGKKPQKRFTPPTVDEVADYCFERRNGIDAQHFVDYYAQQKWKLSNGNPMGDWKAAVRTWESRDRERKPQREQQGRRSWAEIAAEMEAGV